MYVLDATSAGGSVSSDVWKAEMELELRRRSRESPSSASWFSDGLRIDLKRAGGVRSVSVKGGERLLIPDGSALKHRRLAAETSIRRRQPECKDLNRGGLSSFLRQVLYHLTEIARCPICSHDLQLQLITHEKKFPLATRKQERERTRDAEGGHDALAVGSLQCVH